MKQWLFLLAFIPFLATAQEKQTDSLEWEGWFISDCQTFVLNQITKADKGELSKLTDGRVTENTKTIYIVKKSYLQKVPDTAENGIIFKYVNVDSNLKVIAEDVKKNDAAIYFISSFNLDSKLCTIWVMPIDIVKKGMFGQKKEYAKTVGTVNFFFNYDPPKYYYRGVDIVQLDQ